MPTDEPEPPRPPEFFEEEHGAKFDLENAEVVIPAEVEEDVDNDWLPTEEDLDDAM